MNLGKFKEVPRDELILQQTGSSGPNIVSRGTMALLQMISSNILSPNKH